MTSRTLPQLIIDLGIRLETDPLYRQKDPRTGQTFRMWKICLKRTIREEPPAGVGRAKTRTRQLTLANFRTGPDEDRLSPEEVLRVLFTDAQTGDAFDTFEAFCRANGVTDNTADARVTYERCWARRCKLREFFWDPLDDLYLEALGALD